MYLGLFQSRTVLITAEDKFNLLYNMSISLMLLCMQHLLFEKAILSYYEQRVKVVYYILNYFIIFIGMIDKLVEFDQAWDKKGNIALNFVSSGISIFVAYYVF